MTELPDTHTLDDPGCRRCTPGYPKRCACGGLIHADRRAMGDVALACDRCLWEGRPLGADRDGAR